MDKVTTWRWRIVVIGDDWVTEHPFRGPRWLAKRHVRHLFHESSDDLPLPARVQHVRDM